MKGIAMRGRRAPFSLYKRRGQYYARFWSELEQRYFATRATGETNKTRAAGVAAGMLERGEVVPRSRDPLLLEYLREYWHHPMRSVGERYRAENEGFIDVVAQWPEIKRMRLSDLDRAALYRLRDWIAGRKPARMTNRIMQAVRVPVSVAFERAQIPTNPTVGVKKVSEASERRGALTVEEMRKLIAWTGEKRIHAALLLAGLAGLRRGELRALRWANVDFSEGVIHVVENYVDTDGLKEPKAGSKRLVMLHPALDGVLRELAAESPYSAPDDFVLPQAERRRPIGDVTVRRGFTQAMDAIGIDAKQRKARKISLHALRHTFVSHMRQQLPDYLVQAQAGHTTGKMTDAYSDRRVIDFESYRKAVAGMYVEKKKRGKRSAH